MMTIMIKRDLYAFPNEKNIRDGSVVKYIDAALTNSNNAPPVDSALT